MEKELEQFLKERDAVTADTLTYMKEEKIDKAVIHHMTEEELKKFIPKMGDRMSVKRFCREGIASCSSQKRLSLIERIKLNQQASNKNETQSSASQSTSLIAKRSPNIKPTRIINLGWILDGTPVRERNGGGTRAWKISKEAKKEAILEQALKLFFPDGVSSTGKILSEYTYDILDYKQHVFENTLTIGEMYQITGLSVLRFYLSTNSIIEVCLSSSEENTSKKIRKPRRKNSKKMKKEPYLEENKYEKDFKENSQKDQDLKFEGLDEYLVFNTNKSECFEIERDHSRSFSNTTDDLLFHHDEFLNQETLVRRQSSDDVECTQLVTSLLHEDADYLSVQNISSMIEAPQPTAAALSTTTTLVLHRGQIFKEMTEEFLKIKNLDTYIEVEIIGCNGAKESAFDGGGVFKDALTEYWSEFYEAMCEGSSCKIPEINYMYTDVKWKAIAKVLLLGYRLVKYFPTKLPQAFVEYATLGKDKSDLIEAYLNFVAPVDADVLRKTLFDFETVEYDEVMDVLSNIECKQIVNKNNIKKVIYDLAHATIIQKPMFILDCWAEILKNKFSSADINYIYENCKVTNRSVLQLIVTYDCELNSNKEKLMGYLKRFIREADNDLLCRFLRFCTGANIITCNNIQVEFNRLEGAERRPTSHTCNNILVLPLSYSNESYRVFKLELNNILKSNMWCMDII